MKKKRNPVAKLLSDGRFRQKKLPSKQAIEAREKEALDRKRMKEEIDPKDD